ncbi:hypothetical protein [Avibacterium paragallinarum]|uniref:Uncharacterized protein n=1 Tax=Avibacterium paragallinarum TaxID=728 RepID=A0A0F5EVG2_AVIPA|nr:hypothetical protein [Avibacterium paragallinarum]KKB00385.1 hypothetical protein Z012_11570 [Avibacterium paragallinarum]WAL56331.1 hypothetical protein OY678_10200 [Avibacterium paragallinarum]WAM58916.1 hypothetical protein OW731_10315 [Avibacterium paragallinarum]SUU97863.1 Uncharacterised protein [Avibacterium paragallinarum]
MLVRNIEPRLIRLDGVFIAPNQEIEVAENAVGLASLLERGTLIQINTANLDIPEGNSEAPEGNSEVPETKSEKSNKGKK